MAEQEIILKECYHFTQVLLYIPFVSHHKSEYYEISKE